MAILAPQTADNFAHVEYHKILKAELICNPSVPDPYWHIIVGMYASEYARDMNPQNPTDTCSVIVPLDSLPVDPRVELYQYVLNDARFKNTNATTAQEDDPKSLSAVKTKKFAEISAAKVQANDSYFEFDGHRFQANTDALKQIQVTMNGILARGALREDWNGAWLDMDNQPYPIPDVETWFAFYAAIEETGQKNFDHARALKALLNQCTAVNQVQSLYWGRDTSLPLPDPIPDSTEADPPAPEPTPESEAPQGPVEAEQLAPPDA